MMDHLVLTSTKNRLCYLRHLTLQWCQKLPPYRCKIIFKIRFMDWIWEIRLFYGSLSHWTRRRILINNHLKISTFTTIPNLAEFLNCLLWNTLLLAITIGWVINLTFIDNNFSDNFWILKISKLQFLTSYVN